MASSLASPFASPLLNLPIEIRREIYHYYFLACPKLYSMSDIHFSWPNPDLLNNTSYMRVCPPISPTDQNAPHRPIHPRFKITSLIGINSQIREEAEDVLYRRFVLLFKMNLRYHAADSFTSQASPHILSRIARIMLYIDIDPERAPSATELSSLRDRRKVSELFAREMLGLRSVCFDVIARSNPVSASSHKYMVQKCLYVAGPYKDVPGFQVRWVGAGIGARIAQLCADEIALGDWEPDMLYPWARET